MVFDGVSAAMCVWGVLVVSLRRYLVEFPVCFRLDCLACVGVRCGGVKLVAVFLYRHEGKKRKRKVGESDAREGKGQDKEEMEGKVEERVRKGRENKEKMEEREKNKNG